jgi:serine phosphatase RsbU (regulator of sigma subunit)
VAALAQLNAELLERPTLSLVTVCCAVLRPGEETTEADIILAGHPPALHLRGGHCEAVGDFAPLLGFDAEPVWATRTIALEPGDHLVLYTDGVIERAGPDDRFGEERLAACLAGAAGAEDAVRRIERALERFAPGPQDDDTAVLAVERLLTPAAGTRPRAGTTRDQACR